MNHIPSALWYASVGIPFGCWLDAVTKGSDQALKSVMYRECLFTGYPMFITNRYFYCTVNFLTMTATSGKRKRLLEEN